MYCRPKVAAAEVGATDRTSTPALTALPHLTPPSPASCTCTGHTQGAATTTHTTHMQSSATATHTGHTQGSATATHTGRTQGAATATHSGHTQGAATATHTVATYPSHAPALGLRMACLSPGLSNRLVAAAYPAAVAPGSVPPRAPHPRPQRCHQRTCMSPVVWRHGFEGHGLGAMV